MTPAEVKEARENLGWTLEKLGIQAGLSGTTIWAYESGTKNNLRAKYLERIVKALEKGNPSMAPLTPDGLKEARKACGQSQYAFAKACGLSIGTISAFERGSLKIHEATMAKIVQFLKVRRTQIGCTEVNEAISRPDHLPGDIWRELESIEHNVKQLREMLEEARNPQDYWLVRNHLASMCHNISHITWKISENQLKEQP